MTTKFTFTRDVAGAPVFEKKLDDICKEIFAAGQSGRGGLNYGVRIARELHDAAGEEVQRRIRDVRVQNSKLDYKRAAQYVFDQAPHYHYVIALDILKEDARGLDFDAELQEGA
jgi:hypothetical protein